jgi:hypothetical protein
MRTLIGLVLLALAGFLIWHGIDTAERGRRELDAGKAAGGYETLHRLYPYSEAAIDAREVVFESQLKARAGAAETRPTTEVLKKEARSIAVEIPDRTRKGISTEAPYVHPEAAAIVGVAGLLLALILPRTRFRGLAFLALLLGGLASLAAMLPVDTQVGLVGSFKPLRYVITSFPRVAQACVALAAITMIAQVRRGASPPSS